MKGYPFLTGTTLWGDDGGILLTSLSPDVHDVDRFVRFDVGQWTVHCHLMGLSSVQPYAAGPAPVLYIYRGPVLGG